MTVRVTAEKAQKRGLKVLGKETKSKKYEGVYFRDLEGGDRSYFLRIRIDGQTKRIPIGKKSEGITEAFCNKEKARIVNASRFGDDVARELQKVSKKDPTFAELVDHFLENSSVKDSTKKGIAKLKQFPFAKQRRITQKDLQTFIDDLAKRQRPTTVGLRTRQIKQVIRYAIKRGVYTYTDPTTSLDLPKGTTASRQRFLTAEELGQLLEAVKDRPHLYLFVKMAMCTGARLNTLLTVQKSDIAPDGSVKLKNHKADRFYKGFFDAETMELIKPLSGYVLGEEGKTDRPPRRIYIQRPILMEMDRLFNTPDTPTEMRACIHSIRHSVATQLISKGIPLEVVSKTLDHASLSTTANFYAHVATDLVKKATKGMWD